MKAAAPRGKTGKLADSVRLETDERAARVTIKAGGPKTQTANSTDYALHIEFGTQKMPAQPFFWPTWRAEKNKARKRINAATKKAIETTR